MPFEVHGHRADSFFQAERATASRRESAVRQHPRRTDRRVASERQLRAWRKDAHARDTLRLRRWQDERRLGQVHFTGDSLHLRVGEARWVEKDGQLITAELPVGKNIHGNEGVASRQAISVAGGQKSRREKI